MDEPVRNVVRVGAAGRFDQRGGRQRADRLRIERLAFGIVARVSLRLSHVELRVGDRLTAKPA